jgi:hypothetical protein
MLRRRAKFHVTIEDDRNVFIWRIVAEHLYPVVFVKRTDAFSQQF